MANLSFDHKFKILILGDAGSGKTSLTRRFALNDFQASYMATIGIDFLETIVQVPSGERIKLQIWDTAGQERFKTLIRPYYRGASGIVLVYDVTDETTFEHIKEWMVAIEENIHASQVITKVIIANKIDLTQGRQVSSERGQDLASSFNVPIMEVSAKTGENVANSFMQLASLVLKASNSSSTPSSVSGNSVFLPTEIDVKEPKKKKCCEFQS